MEARMTDQQTWEQACDLAGVKKYPCVADIFHFRRPAFHHHVNYPPIGDSAACMVMLDYLVKQPLFLARVQAMFVDAVRGNQTVPLALAAAVCALKEKA
jgi:hypothetical protein